MVHDNTCMCNCSSSLYLGRETLFSWLQLDINSSSYQLFSYIDNDIFQSTWLQLDISSCSYQSYSVIALILLYLAVPFFTVTCCFCLANIFSEEYSYYLCYNTCTLRNVVWSKFYTISLVQAYFFGSMSNVENLL